MRIRFSPDESTGHITVLFYNNTFSIFDHLSLVLLDYDISIARLESRQQQQRCIVVTVIPLNFCCDYKSPSLTENGNNHSSYQQTSPEESLRDIILITNLAILLITNLAINFFRA